MPELMNKQESVWKRLTRLFRSGPVVRHKISAAEPIREPMGTARAYKKELSSLYIHSLASYGQYERFARYADYGEMEQCLAPDTLIATPDGFRTIKELSETHGLESDFIVYSYDHMKREIVPALARQARKTRTDVALKVTFDNGKTIVCSKEHRLMLRDGSYRRAENLKPGDAMMPFHRKSFYSKNGHDDRSDYQFIYNMKRWVSEHKMIAEWVAGRSVLETEHVHHINFQRGDNRPENLLIMDAKEHLAYHTRLNNKKKWNTENSEWIEKFKKNHSEFMKNFNPAERRDVTFPKILQVAEQNGFNLAKTSKFFDADYGVIYHKLLRYGFKNWTSFARAYDDGWRNNGWDNRGDKNPRYDSSLTFQMVCDAHVPGISANRLAEKLGTTPMKADNRVRANGFRSLSQFCSDYQNCKVVSVEEHGEIDLYDITVDRYKNFATDSVISHNTPEIASALNILADETTNQNEKGEVIRIVSKNQEIKAVLGTFFNDVININFNSWSWARNLIKYGDFFLFVDASESNGILNLLPIPVNEIEREEGYDKKDPFAVRFRWITQGNEILQNWQVIHFRLLGSDNFLPYGSSMIEPARRIWRQLILIEDAMLVYRIVRSPERRVFKIDVGNVPPDKIEEYMEQVKNKLRRNQIIDPNTGRVDLRYNPLSVDEDYFIPTRGDRGSDISTLPGGQFTGDIDDVQYIQNKMFAALMIPKAYLGYEGDIGSKATLAQQDVRFSRTIQRIQKIFIAELEKIAMVHLFLLGYDGEELVDFNIEMANPSTIAQQQKLDLWRMRLEVAGSAGGTASENLFDRRFIYEEMFGLSDEQIERINDGKRTDKLEDLALESMQMPGEGADETEAGGEGPLPGEEELPQTLGGPTPDEGGGAQASAEPREPVNQSTPPAGPVLGEEEDDGIEEKNMGSTGDRAEVSVDRGKDLFATGEDLFSHVFATKKQTASDPGDMRATRRLVTRPLSEALKFSVFAPDVLDEAMSEVIERSRRMNERVTRLMESSGKAGKGPRGL